ncbi:MAG TPA: MBL fold metallo-hydrolase [Treponemataceae bacterium]|nr:MBL fold metallo-hydrolase [Treponemataceae bacterium]
MRIHFWGVRGSIPSPLTPVQIQNRIAAVVQRISSKDVVSSDTKERFIASLPDWLFGTVGGNTSCVEIENSTKDCIILDAGSGLRELSVNLKERSASSFNKIVSNGTTYHIIFSHFHWDHMQGLPFFSQAFNPSNRIIFYSPNENMKTILANQMRQPYFPVPMQGSGGFAAKLEFVHLDSPSKTFKIGSTTIAWNAVNHPGGCTAYMFSEEGKKIVYATDIELDRNDFLKTPENDFFYSGADLLIIDSQYTMGEAIEKNGWGHSAFSLSVDFALTWGVKTLVLFHHEPTYTDQKIYSLRQSAEWYSQYAGPRPVDIQIAREGLDLYT